MFEGSATTKRSPTLTEMVFVDSPYTLEPWTTTGTNRRRFRACLLAGR
jgi:hypothetical protein